MFSQSTKINVVSLFFITTILLLPGCASKDPGTTSNKRIAYKQKKIVKSQNQIEKRLKERLDRYAKEMALINSLKEKNLSEEACEDTFKKEIKKIVLHKHKTFKKYYRGSYWADTFLNTGETNAPYSVYYSYLTSDISKVKKQLKQLTKSKLTNESTDSFKISLQALLDNLNIISDAIKTDENYIQDGQFLRTHATLVSKYRTSA